MAAVDPFGLPPDEAIRWFKQKGYALNFDWRDQWGQAHARAFTVAKATQLDILADIREAVDKALKSGSTLQDFKKQLRPTLQSKGWWGEKEMVDPKTGEKKLVQLGSAARLRTIYETNLRQAQAAGRWERFERTKAARPYGRYVAILDGRERDAHKAWHGTVLPLDHPWWNTHAPPNGWGCRCKLQQLSDRDLARYGYEVSTAAPPSKMVTYVNDRTGQRMQVPAGIDPGFDYNPGKVPRGFTPPDNAPELTPTRTFADYGLPRAKDIADREAAPPRWDAPHGPADRERLFTQFKALFGGEQADVADPQGMQTTFSTKLLEYLLKKEPARATFIPSAKATVEKPAEVWMVPFRMRDGTVKMRKRYISYFADQEGGHMVVVDRGDDGYAAWSTYPSRSIDSQRQGYLLYPG